MLGCGFKPGTVDSRLSAGDMADADISQMSKCGRRTELTPTLQQTLVIYYHNTHFMRVLRLRGKLITTLKSG